MRKLLLGAFATTLITIGVAAQTGTVHLSKGSTTRQMVTVKHQSMTPAPVKRSPGPSMGRLVESPAPATPPAPPPPPPPGDDGD